MVTIKHAKTNNIPDWTQAQLNIVIAGGQPPLPPAGTVLADITLSTDWNQNLVTSMATGKIIGRSTAGTGSFEEISIGTGLSLSAGTISGTLGDVVGPSSSTDNAVARFDGTTGKLIQNSAVTVDDSGNITANTGIFINGTQYTANPFTGIIQTVSDTDLQFFINGGNPFGINLGGNQSNVDMLMGAGTALKFDGSNYIYSADGDHINITAKKNLSLMIGAAAIVDITSNAITLTDGVNVVTGTSTGSRIFNAANQKGSFWSATPIIQPANSTAIDALLTNTGLRASGGIANFATQITSNSLPVIVILSSTTGIDAKSVATTNLYTVPTGKTAIITGATIRCTAASAITVGPTLGMGVAAGEDDIFASAAITALTTTAKIFGFASMGMSVSAAAATIIKLGIDVASTGTSQTVAVDLFGYLI